MKYGDSVTTRIPVIKHNGDIVVGGTYWEVRDKYFSQLLKEEVCRIVQPEYQERCTVEDRHSVTIATRLLVRL